eukprot:499730_1
MNNMNNMNNMSNMSMNADGAHTQYLQLLQQQQVAAQQQAAFQQQQLAQQQQIHYQQQMQQQQQNNNNNNKIGNWVNQNYPKPQMSSKNGIASSPILHSMSPIIVNKPPSQQPNVLYMLNNGNNNNNMNLSQSSDKGPGNDNNNQSKSKIFEHKKALKNVSPETEVKLQELQSMGYKNRTFNLVLLKQENG